MASASTFQWMYLVQLCIAYSKRGTVMLHVIFVSASVSQVCGEIQEVLHTKWLPVTAECWDEQQTEIDKLKLNMRLEVFMVVKIQVTACWVVMLFSVVVRYLMSYPEDINFN
jgi:hypothetical protein